MSEWVIIPVLAILLPIVIVPIVLGIRASLREREFVHIERMRAIELGVVHPSDRPKENSGRLAFLMVAVVPFSLFCIAAGSGRHGDEEIIWGAAAVVSVVSVVNGSRLARARSMESATTESIAGKNGVHDPDAFDVVGRRG